MVVDAQKKDKMYSYDTDISAGFDEGIEQQNRELWISFVLSFDAIDDFLAEPMPSFTGKEIQKRLAKFVGRKSQDCRAEITSVLNEMEHVTFIEGQRLEKYLKNVDSERWGKFLQEYTHKPGRKIGLNRRLAKVGGFAPEKIENVYVISPNGDPDWKKWAALIPPGLSSKWEGWKGKQALDGTIIPGNGKLVRVV